MNWTIIIIETIIMTIAFTAMILIPLVKNPVWWIHDYPKGILEEYFKTHKRVPSEFFSKTVLVKKGFALVLALLLNMTISNFVASNETNDTEHSISSIRRSRRLSLPVSVFVDKQHVLSVGYVCCQHPWFLAHRAVGRVSEQG